MKTQQDNLLYKILELVNINSVRHMTKADEIDGSDEEYGAMKAFLWLYDRITEMVPARQIAKIKTYSLPDGILLYIPGVNASDSPDFETIFKQLPANKTGIGFLGIGKWDPLEDSRPWENFVFLYLGPDGHVWAQVDELDNIPDLEAQR